MIPNRSHVFGIFELLKTGTGTLFRSLTSALAAGIATAAVMTLPAEGQIHRINSDETVLFKKISHLSGQQRSSMNLDPILCLVARQRGADMARRHYFGHTTPDGKGANYLIGQAGYLLPSYYDLSRSGNNIESIGMSPGPAKQMVALWLNSSAHRSHVLGELEFFREQTSVGVGVFRSSTAPYYKYYVLLSAPPNGTLKPRRVVLINPRGVTIATTRPLADAFARFTGMKIR